MRGLQRQIWRARGRGVLPRKTFLHSPANAPVVEDLPPLSSFSLEDPLPASFPLYHPHPPPLYRSAPRNPTGKGKELPSEAKIQKALKARLTASLTNGAPELDEGELRTFYAALIESGRQEPPPPRFQEVGAPDERLRLSDGQRGEVLHGLVERLLFPRTDGEDAPESSSAALQRSQQRNDTMDELLGLLQTIASNAATQRIEGGADVPLGLVSRQEWDALYDEAISSRDPRKAEGIVTLRAAHGQPADASHLSNLITSYAECGMLDDVYRLEEVLRQSGGLLSPSQHDLIVLRLLQLSPTTQSAISHLKHFESLASPAPRSAYHLILSHLFTASPTSHSRALAWDLFAHMRLKAHPTPSRDIYTTMISSCATSSDPRPEQARDLWTELTVDEGFIPETAEYNAIIRALSSTKRDYLEAFDLFRQMLARHHEATYVPFGESHTATDTRWVPTLDTWKALLEGTKRAGDLGRARWVLSECVKLVDASRKVGMDISGPDEAMMASVFMSYAAWRPTVRRSLVKEKDAVSASANQESSDAAPLADPIEVEDTGVQDIGNGAAILPHGNSPDASATPQTSAEAIREANALFSQILSDAESPTRQALFHNVKISSRLVNSYLSVHFAHAPSLEAAQNTWRSTWTKSGATPNGWSYMQALERCALGNRATGSSTDRDLALEWGKEFWSAYLSFAASASSVVPETTHSLGLSHRQVERSWRAIIRLHALSEDLSGALDLLDDFHHLYPPQNILEGYIPAIDNGLEMRFTDPTSLLEPHVPPHLIFSDIDVLHQRLVRDEEWKKVGHVKWVVKSYESALAKRRKWRLRGVGRAREARKANDMMLSLGSEEYKRLQAP